MAWGDDIVPEPGTEDLLKALDGYVDAKMAHVAHKKHVDDSGGYRYDPDYADALDKAVDKVGKTLDAIMDRRIEAKLRDLGILPTAPSVDTDD